MTEMGALQGPRHHQIQVTRRVIRVVLELLVVRVMVTSKGRGLLSVGIFAPSCSVPLALRKNPKTLRLL